MIEKLLGALLAGAVFAAIAWASSLPESRKWWRRPMRWRR